MNSLLSPDKNNLILKRYHTSSKMLLPGLLTSYFCNKYELNYGEKIVHCLNIGNIGFHSYISTSCIITDYIKPKILSNIFRPLNLGLHTFGCIGYLYYLKKKS